MQVKLASLQYCHEEDIEALRYLSKGILQLHPSNSYACYISIKKNLYTISILNFKKNIPEWELSRFVIMLSHLWYLSCQMNSTATFVTC